MDSWGSDFTANTVPDSSYNMYNMFLQHDERVFCMPVMQDYISTKHRNKETGTALHKMHNFTGIISVCAGVQQCIRTM